MCVVHHCCCCVQTELGKAPDIWRRLPQEALQLAVRRHGLTHTAAGFDGSLRALVNAAAGHTAAVEGELQRTCEEQQQLQQEVQELRATVEAVNQREQQQQQELAELRAAVAAMEAQLQLLLPQK